MQYLAPLPILKESMLIYLDNYTCTFTLAALTDGISMTQLPKALTYHPILDGFSSWKNYQVQCTALVFCTTEGSHRQFQDELRNCRAIVGQPGRIRRLSFVAYWLLYRVIYRHHSIHVFYGIYHGHTVNLQMYSEFILTD